MESLKQSAAVRKQQWYKKEGVGRGTSIESKDKSCSCSTPVLLMSLEFTHHNHSSSCRSSAAAEEAPVTTSKTTTTASVSATSAVRVAPCVAVVKNFMLMATRSFVLNLSPRGRRHVWVQCAALSVWVFFCVSNGVTLLPFFGGTFMRAAYFLLPSFANLISTCAHSPSAKSIRFHSCVLQSSLGRRK